MTMGRQARTPTTVVMPGLVPGIHASPYVRVYVAGRDKPGHDGNRRTQIAET